MHFTQSASLTLAIALITTASATAQAQRPVQWQVSDGGNGHWYAAVSVPSTISWPDSASLAAQFGGHLATMLSPSEEAFVWSIAQAPQLWNGHCGPWFGLFQATGSTEPAGGWTWVTGEPLTWANWHPGAPDNYGCAFGAQESSGHFFNGSPTGPARYWNDLPPEVPCKTLYPMPVGLLIEWSDDCNSDGLVDYGQLLQGELLDLNFNYVPDCCEGKVLCDPCPGDVTDGGTIDATDLSIVLAAWGTDGLGEFDADADNSGFVDGGDLALVLSAWGPCPQ
jgi:hypothetical protein